MRHGGMPSTLRPKPEGFAAWCPLAPSARPCMAFLFIAPRLCLGLPSHQASRLASRYRLIIAFGSKRSCHWLVLFHNLLSLLNITYRFHVQWTLTTSVDAHAGRTKKLQRTRQRRAPLSLALCVKINMSSLVNLLNGTVFFLVKD